MGPSVKIESPITQDEFMDFAAEQNDSHGGSEDDYEPSDGEIRNDEDKQQEEENTDEESKSHQYEQLQIEPVTENSYICIRQEAAHSYASVKKPLKTFSKSEIANPSSAHCQTGHKSHDYDSSCDQSADDSGAQDPSDPPASKKPRGDLPKQCYVCGLIVTRMRDHMKSHPNELQYKCEHCPKSYLTKTGRDRHMDGQHPEMR